MKLFFKIKKNLYCYSLGKTQDFYRVYSKSSYQLSKSEDSNWKIYFTNAKNVLCLIVVSDQARWPSQFKDYQYRDSY